MRLRKAVVLPWLEMDVAATSPLPEELSMVEEVEVGAQRKDARTIVGRYNYWDYLFICCILVPTLK